jgi:vitamin B12 transporter
MLLLQKLKSPIYLLTYFCISISPIQVLSYSNSNQDSIHTTKTNTIVVTAQRQKIPLEFAAKTINIISNEEIRNSSANSIQDLLFEKLGIDIRQRGNYGVQADISIRGGNFEQTLVLLNGINMNNPQTGHHNMDLPVNLDDVERIEILETSSSRILGINAFAGAINIITNKFKNENEADKIAFNLNYGNNNFYNSNLSYNFTTNDIHNYISINKKNSESYIPNTDFDQFSSFYQTTYNSPNSTNELQIGYMQKSFGAFNFYTSDFPNQFESTKSIIASFQNQTILKEADKSNDNEKDNVNNEKLGQIIVKPIISWLRHYDRFELFRNNPASWYSNHNYHQTNVYTGNLNFEYSSTLGTSNLGIEYRSENILSNVLGDKLCNPIEIESGIETKYSKSKSRDIFTMNFEQSKRFENLFVSGGLIINHFDENWKIYPGLDIAYKFSSELSVFANINKSLRLPTFTEMYYSDPVSLGNPNIKAEVALSYEIGSKYNNEQISANISIFRRNGSKMIDWVKKSNDSLWRSQNLAEVNSSGISLNCKFITSKSNDYISIAYTYIQLDKNPIDPKEFVSEYVMDFMKNKITFSLSQNLFSEIKGNLNITYADRAASYMDYQEKKIKDYEPYILVDLKLQRQMSELYKNLSLSLICNNVFDQHYHNISNVALPGRWVGIGMKLNS